MTMNAFQLLSNYSFGYYGFVDIVDDVIEYLNRYAFQELLMDDPGRDFWIEFLKYLDNDYVIRMLADAVTLSYYEIMQGFDRDTYEGDTYEAIQYFINGVSHEERAEEFRRMYNPTTRERVFDTWVSEYVFLYEIGEIEVVQTFQEVHFGQANLAAIKNKVHHFDHKKIFNKSISEELVAAAMHPCRIKAQMDQFNDIEAFFNAIGC